METAPGSDTRAITCARTLIATLRQASHRSCRFAPPRGSRPNWEKADGQASVSLSVNKLTLPRFHVQQEVGNISCMGNRDAR